MARKRRSYLPGVIFHVTTRTQGHEPWFTPALRTTIAGYIADAFRGQDAQLLAYAVMPNHLHVVIRQGVASLSDLMQPPFRRIALLVQRHHGVEGHVFERRFRDVPCQDPDHARNAIAYVHLNPVRARLGTTIREYPWTTRALYMQGGPGAMRPTSAAGVVEPEVGLRLFAPADDVRPLDSRLSYRRYEEWRLRCDAEREADSRGLEVGAPAPPPLLRGGDVCWAREYAPLFSGPGRRSRTRSDDDARMDLRDIALQVLSTESPGLSLDRVRSPEKCRRVVRVRREIVRRLNAAGHRGGAIARYLRVSNQCVSNILAADRVAAQGNRHERKG